MAGNSKSSKASTKPSEEADQAAEEQIDSAAGTAADTESVDEVSAEDAAKTGDAAETAEAGTDASDDTAEPGVDETPETEEASAVPGVISVHNAPEPSPAPVSAATASTASGPGTFALVFGGLVAGAIGFLVATFAVPEGWPNPAPSGSDQLEAEVSAQAERLEALAAELASIQDAPPVVAEGGEAIDLGPLTDRLAALETSLADVASSTSESLTALSDQFAAFGGRLTELEARPETVVPDGSAAMEAQMEDFRQQLDAVTADAEARIADAQNRASQIEAEAAAAAGASERKAALAAVMASLENGTPFSEPLSAFDAPPEGLASVAGKGVPTLSALQDEFPAAARMALSEVQSVPADASAGERFTAFLRRQTNARSLAPRDGSNADAILSRAEAAVAAGDLDSALTELSALPETASAAMSDWIAAAETRAEAMAAAAALETESN